MNASAPLVTVAKAVQMTGSENYKPAGMSTYYHLKIGLNILAILN